MFTNKWRVRSGLHTGRMFALHNFGVHVNRTLLNILNTVVNPEKVDYTTAYEEVMASMYLLMVAQFTYLPKIAVLKLWSGDPWGSMGLC